MLPQHLCRSTTGDDHIVISMKVVLNDDKTLLQITDIDGQIDLRIFFHQIEHLDFHSLVGRNA